MNYIRTEADGQPAFAETTESLMIPSMLYGFHNTSSGKIEGINNKIKTLRRQSYGYPDDEYFFLKIMDASRVDYVRNPKSHRILH